MEKYKTYKLCIQIHTLLPGGKSPWYSKGHAKCKQATWSISREHVKGSSLSDHHPICTTAATVQNTHCCNQYSLKCSTDLIYCNNHVPFSHEMFWTGLDCHGIYGVSWPSGRVHRIQVMVASECGFESRPGRSQHLRP